MTKILVNRNKQSELYSSMLKELRDKDCNTSILAFTRSPENWSEIEAIASVATQYFNKVLDCVEIDDIDTDFFLLKYSEIVYKVLANELDDELFEKMKKVGSLSKEIVSFEKQLNSLQSTERELYDLYSDIVGGEPNTYYFNDYGSDEHIEQYSLKDEDLKAVFDDFFS
jgi:hypothetical protein